MSILPLDEFVGEASMQLFDIHDRGISAQPVDGQLPREWLETVDVSPTKLETAEFVEVGIACGFRSRSLRSTVLKAAVALCRKDGRQALFVIVRHDAQAGYF